MSQKTTDIQIQIKIRGWTVSDIIQIYIRDTHTHRSKWTNIECQINGFKWALYVDDILNGRRYVDDILGSGCYVDDILDGGSEWYVDNTFDGGEVGKLK